MHAAPTKCPRETSARFHGAAKPGRVWRAHYRSIGAMDSTPLACTTPGDSMHGLRNTSHREWCSLWLCKLWAEGKKQKRKDAIPPLPRPSIREVEPGWKNSKLIRSREAGIVKGVELILILNVLGDATSLQRQQTISIFESVILCCVKGLGDAVLVTV